MSVSKSLVPAIDIEITTGEDDAGNPIVRKFTLVEDFNSLALFEEITGDPGTDPRSFLSATNERAYIYTALQKRHSGEFKDCETTEDALEIVGAWMHPGNIQYLRDRCFELALAGMTDDEKDRARKLRKGETEEVPKDAPLELVQPSETSGSTPEETSDSAPKNSES